MARLVNNFADKFCGAIVTPIDQINFFVSFLIMHYADRRVWFWSLIVFLPFRFEVSPVAIQTLDVSEDALPIGSILHHQHVVHFEQRHRAQRLVRDAESDLRRATVVMQLIHQWPDERACFRITECVLRTVINFFKF